jgi:beta-N-acetylhexosaminidase
MRKVISAAQTPKALTKVLFGEVNPTGKLPVTIPEAGDLHAALYPFGHGLSYGG